MTPEQIYDWLVAKGVSEPAVCQLGDRCIVGIWVDLSEQPSDEKGPQMIFRSKSKGVEVTVERPSWAEVFEFLEENMGRSGKHG